jgi:iron complex transport system substrate-binding protein
MVQLIRDAGGEYLFREIEGADSRPIDIEEAFWAMQQADYWLNTNHYSSLAELVADNPRFVSTPPVRTGRVYNNNARMTPAGGSDFWESAVVRPDIVLRDLIEILHPGSGLGGVSESGSEESTHTLYYYKKLE